MKIDRHKPDQRFRRATDRVSLGIGLLIGVLIWPAESQANDPSADEQANRFMVSVMDRLANGSAFDAKVREKIWTTGREVPGVGTYVQSGQGAGRYRLQVAMHDGVGKHQLQQVADGRLAWTRLAIADRVTLRRVNLGLLRQKLGDHPERDGVAISFQVGGFIERLETIRRQYDLRLAVGTLDYRRVWIVSGKLKDEVREQILAQSGRGSWPAMCPAQVRVAFAAEDDPQTQFGLGLPVRFEFLTDATSEPGDASSKVATGSRLISLIELYSVRPIATPPESHFRFENTDADVNFTDDTQYYLDRLGSSLTES
ncbi:MAG: hypothetical protein AAGA03_07675 [Planctomycetota bacterium]